MKYIEKIRNFIEGSLIKEEGQAQFLNSDNLFELGFVDSLFAMNLVNYIEHDFNIKIENEDLDITNFNSVDNIVNFINIKNLASN